MSIPNLITLGRILLVPVVVWAIIYGELWLAFVLFLAVLFLMVMSWRRLRRRRGSVMARR